MKPSGLSHGMPKSFFSTVREGTTTTVSNNISHNVILTKITSTWAN